MFKNTNKNGNNDRAFLRVTIENKSIVFLSSFYIGNTPLLLHSMYIMYSEQNSSHTNSYQSRSLSHVKHPNKHTQFGLFQNSSQHILLC